MNHFLIETYEDQPLSVRLIRHNRDLIELAMRETQYEYRVVDAGTIPADSQEDEDLAEVLTKSNSAIGLFDGVNTRWFTHDEAPPAHEWALSACYSRCQHAFYATEEEARHFMTHLYDIPAPNKYREKIQRALKNTFMVYDNT